MEVAWCKQNVCMMFDLLGCQGAACCTAKVHEGTDEVLEGTAQEYESTAGANLSTAEVYESTAHSLFKISDSDDDVPKDGVFSAIHLNQVVPESL
ncbi:hypothetical protein Tco_0779238 [Tanacetum coccineum]